VVASLGVAIVGSVLLVMRDSGAKTTTLGVTATLHVSGHPAAVSAGPDALWVALSRDSPEPAGDPRLLRVDLATRSPARPVYIGGEISHLTRVGDHLIASVQHPSGAGQLGVLEWRTGIVLVRHWFDRPVDQTVFRAGDLWALERPGTLLRLDSGTLEQTSAPLALSRGRILGLASASDYLWATAADAGKVLRIDPVTREIRSTHVGGAPIGIVVTGGKVWFADQERGTVVRLDPRSLRQVGEPIGVGEKPSRLVAAAGSVFVTHEDNGTLTRIDVQSGKTEGLPIRIAAPTVDSPAPSVAAAGQSFWIASFAAKTVDRVDATATPDSRSGKITVRISHTNDKHQGDPVINGGLAGIGNFVASGLISDKGKLFVYRTVKPPLITLRFVASGSRGTITFVVKIDTNFGTSRWTIASGTGAYKGLHGEGVEHENSDFTVQTLTGTVSR
jgi:hypothetical protein